MNTNTAVAPMPVQDFPALVDFHPTRILAELFTRHGVPTECRETDIAFPGTPYRADIALVRHDDSVFRLDVRLHLDGGAVLTESFAGIGATAAEAGANAMQTFMKGSLHVLLAAFFGKMTQQVLIESWTINRFSRTVTIGAVVTRGGSPGSQRSEVDQWWPHLEEGIRASLLSSGTHWIRFFRAQIDGSLYEPEVLLDNEPWPELIESMAAVPWPTRSGYSSDRLFLVLQDAK